jgi:hypothetical protein
MAAPRNVQTKCNDCDRPFYARGLCKNCYMKSFRDKFGELRTTNEYSEDDLKDFWSFVKKELNIG